MKKIVLTGGGTGGHVIPHLSLLPLLKKDFDEIYYIGTNGIEKEIVSKEKDIKFFEISAVKLDRNKKLKNLLIPTKLIKSIFEAKKILKKLKPDVIFSKGGFVSVPVCIAGRMLKIPIVSHESDLSLGLANKIIYKTSKTFCTTFEKTKEGLKKAVFTGSPIRQKLFLGRKEIGYQKTNLDSSKKTIMVIGGSTGALKINQVLYDCLETLLKTYNVIHIVGKNKGDKTKNLKNYCQIEFCHDIENLFAITDFVISRAGSNAICEFLALQKPMILIPLPRGASRGDQVENAKYFEEKHYAKVLNQDDLTKKTLLDAIEDLEKNKQFYISNMKNEKTLLNGTQNIYKEILKASK